MNWFLTLEGASSLGDRPEYQKLLLSSTFSTLLEHTNSDQGIQNFQFVVSRYDFHRFVSV
jgi:hypothetical protein